MKNATSVLDESKLQETNNNSFKYICNRLKPYMHI